MKQQVAFRKVRGVGEVINETFSFIKENKGNIFKTVFFIAGPFILIGSILYGWIQANLLEITAQIQNPEPGQMPSTSGMFPLTLWMILVLFVTSFFFFAGMYQYIYLYVEGRKDDITTGDIWSGIKKNTWMFIKTLIGLLVLVFIMAFMVGLLSIGIVAMASMFGTFGALISPFFVLGLMAYLLTPLTLLFPIRMFERLRFFNAVGRCYMLISKNWWRTFLVLLLSFLIQFVITFVFAIPNWLVEIFQMHELATGPSKWLLIVGNTLLLISGFLVGVISLVAMTLQYFNLVERKEAAGLIKKIESIGQEPEKPQNEGSY